MRFNPVSSAVSLVAGWTLMSFFQALVSCILKKSIDRFFTEWADIVFFRNTQAVIINVILIIVSAIIGTGFWFAVIKGKM